MAGGKNRHLPAVLRAESTRNVKQHGYTIIEVMIFLAVSGFMFLLAAQFINGKQAQVQFKQSINSVNSTLNSTINDISNGEDQNYNGVNCTGSSGSHPIVSAGSTSQGQNKDCVFMGKVVQFNVGGDNTKFNVYSLVGNRTKSPGDTPVNNFTDAYPIAADDAPGDASYASGVNLTQTETLEGGLSVNKVLSCINNCTNDPTSGTPPTYSSNVPAFGFFGSFNSCGATATQTQSGAQSVITTVLPIPSGKYGTDEGTMATAINTAARAIGTGNYIGSCNSVTPNSFILICFQLEKRFGSITIGGNNGQQFTTDVETGEKVPTVCLS